MISQDTIQQIINRIDVIDIVGSFVKLKKRGSNYMGLCPFHNEKSPSFTVSPAKEIYKCFGCGKSGNSIGFLMDHEKFSYVEALKWLAARYHIEVEETAVSPEKMLQQQTAESLHILNAFAQKYFSEFLWKEEEGQDIGLSYLRERGFSDEIIEKFQIGYSPENRNSFSQHAIQQQYNLETLQKSGLVVVRNEEAYDNYRGRIIFPIHGQTGKILGFGARIIKKNDRAPKYINTPENEIYVKSRILYGSYFAKHAIDKADECLLVEGYTDVVSLHQAGVENVVASGGTSLTIDQLRLIRKYTNNLTIIYDGDGAGVKAALRGLDLALEEGLHVKLVLIPDKEDPDSYVKKIGAEAFREFVAANKKDFILFQLDIALKDAGTDSVKKAAIVSQIAETISKINKTEDFTRQQDYVRQSSEILRIDEGGLLNLVNKFVRERVQKQEKPHNNQQDFNQGYANQPYPGEEQYYGPPPQDSDSLELINKDEIQEKAVVRALLEFGLNEWDETTRVADYFFSGPYEPELFDNQLLLDIINQYKSWYDTGVEPLPKNFIYHDNREISTLVVSLMDFPYEVSSKWKEKYEMPVASRETQYREEIRGTLGYLKLRKIKRLIIQNQQDLEKPHTLEEQLMLIQTHQHLKEMEKELTAQAGSVIVK